MNAPNVFPFFCVKIAQIVERVGSSKKVNAIIEAAIKKIYLKAERPDVASVVEEVRLQCFKSKIKKQPPC